MVLSFQFRKHLNSGGGMILLDNEEHAIALRKFVMDGRERYTPWNEQNIKSYGIHGYMTPEMAGLGLAKLKWAILSEPKKWSYQDYPALTEMDVFK
jgi:dTDP-4-amino-4,6-dideoxygalactose transaminase